jgi:hypothetical protein
MAAWRHLPSLCLSYLNETRSGRTGFSGEFSGEFSVGRAACRDAGLLKTKKNGFIQKVVNNA